MVQRHVIQFDLRTLELRCIVVAGEPGGSVPAIRQRIEQPLAARVMDHAGASEIGPWGFADHDRRGLHVLETDFIAEFLAVDTGQRAVEEVRSTGLRVISLNMAGSE